MKKFKHYLLPFLLIFSNYLVFAAGGGGAKASKDKENTFTTPVGQRTDIPEEVKVEIDSLRKELKASIDQVVKNHYAYNNPEEQQLTLEKMIPFSDIFFNEDLEKQVMRAVEETFSEVEGKLELKKKLAEVNQETPIELSIAFFPKYKELVNDQHNKIYEEFFTEVKAQLEVKFKSDFSEFLEPTDNFRAILEDNTLHAFYKSYLDKRSKNLLKKADLIPNKPGAKPSSERKSIYDDLREGRASVQEICDKNGYTIETLGLKNFSLVSKQEPIIVRDKQGKPILDKTTGLPITKVSKQQAPRQKTQEILAYLDKILSEKFSSLDLGTQEEEAKRLLRIIYSNKALAENLKHTEQRKKENGLTLEKALWANLEKEEAVFIKDEPFLSGAKTSHPFQDMRKKLKSELQEMGKIGEKYNIKVVSYFVPALDKRADADFMNAQLNEKEVRFCEAKSSLTFGNLYFTPPGEYFSNLEQIVSFLLTRGGGVLVLKQPMFMGKFISMVRESLTQEIGEDPANQGQRILILDIA